MKRLLPKIADNNFHGQKVAYYFFIFFMVVNTVRSFIHLLAEDAGLNSIANIIVFEGTPDPIKVIYLLGAEIQFEKVKDYFTDTCFKSTKVVEDKLSYHEIINCKA